MHKALNIDDMTFVVSYKPLSLILRLIPEPQTQNKHLRLDYIEAIMGLLFLSRTDSDRRGSMDDSLQAWHQLEEKETLMFSKNKRIKTDVGI